MKAELVTGEQAETRAGGIAKTATPTIEAKKPEAEKPDAEKREIKTPEAEKSEPARD